MSMNKYSVEYYGPITVHLTPKENSVAYENRIKRLKLAGFSERKARETALQPIIMGLYYDPYQGTFAIEPEIKKGMTMYSPYTGIEVKKENEEILPQIRIITPTDSSETDIAFALKAKIEEIARKGVISLVGQNKGYMLIPLKPNGDLYGLNMLDMKYKTYFFRSINYNGELITFTGTNEKDENVSIDEHDLPDNGLLYLYDYLTTGCY